MAIDVLCMITWAKNSVSLIHYLRSLQNNWDNKHFMLLLLVLVEFFLAGLLFMVRLLNIYSLVLETSSQDTSR